MNEKPNSSSELVSTFFDQKYSVHTQITQRDINAKDGVVQLFHSEAKDETTAFYAYAHPCVCVRNKRYTLVVRHLGMMVKRRENQATAGQGAASKDPV